MKTIYPKEIARKIIQTGQHNWRKAVLTACFLCARFCLGGAAAEITQGMRQAAANAVLESENWGLGFGREGQKPTGNATMEELKKYNTYFCGEGEEKVIYLTFDCGYENGNTEPILDALKKHNAQATFFVVGHFLESAPSVQGLIWLKFAGESTSVTRTEVLPISLLTSIKFSTPNASFA